jgi:hypothetical protein
MTTPRHLGWDRFNREIVVAGEQRMHRISSTPDLCVFWDGSTGRIGIRIGMSKDFEIPSELDQLNFMQTTKAVCSGSNFMELSTDSRSLRKQFYAFVTSVADSVVLAGTDPIQAIISEIYCFEELLREKAILSSERQIGLFGELLVLERLIGNKGPEAAAAWIGPLGEPHDFRVAAAEFEVKTSVGTKRIHTINGMDQLTPSLGCSLAVISILLAPPGSGPALSLPELAERILLRLHGTSVYQNQVSSALAQAGFRDEDRRYYSRRYALRKPLRFMPVASHFPRIDRGAVQAILGNESSRVQHLQYEVDLEGLGVEEPDPGFPNVLKTCATLP